VSCLDCARDLDHCHGAFVRHADGTVECTDPACVDTGHERHGLVVEDHSGLSR